MPKKGMSESIKVASPCTEPWDEMQGNDAVRFCSHCQKNVNNISTMSPREARRLVRRSGGNLCVRYAVNPKTNEPIYAKEFYQISRRAPALAAGVVGATLSLVSLGYAQGGSSPLRVEPDASAARTNEKQEKPTGTLAGTVLDPQGSVVPGRSVIASSSSGITRRATSDENGSYELKELPEGEYTLKAEGGGVFADIALENVQVSRGVVNQQVIALPVITEFTFTSGVVAFVEKRVFKTPLAKAVYNDELKEVADLLARGADPNAREEDGETPIFTAVADGNTEIVRALLLFGANINDRDEKGETPLMQLDDDASVELVELLLSSGAKVNQTAKDGTTALMRAAAESKADVLRRLIDAETEVNAKDKKGWTALMHAAYADDIDKVRMLIFAGADVNAKNDEGETAWDQTTDEDVENLLVSHGAIVDDDEEEDGENGDDASESDN